MPSKYVTQNPDSRKSRLITAFEGLSEALNSGSIPDGMYGRVAIIETNGVKIHSDELDFEFEVPFDDDLESNEATITVYNLSKTTLQAIKSKNKLTITAGYKNDIGVIFSGNIRTVKTKNSGMDKITTITACDYIGGASEELTNKTYKAGTKASYILKDLLNTLDPPIAVFNPKLDYTFKEEVTADGTVWEEIKKYAEICGISVYINKGSIYARHISEGDNTYFTVSADTGLIDSPEEFEEEITRKQDGTDTETTETIKGYNFKMLLQHRMNTAAIIKLNSLNVSGTYRARKGKHIFNSSESITEAEVV